jgi:hypothetical protein
MQPAMVPPAIECKVCGYSANLFGAADSSKSTTAGQPVPPTGKSIFFYRCTNCDFLFTPDFDTWSQADFLREIYNEEYIKVDPDFTSIRPLEYAQTMAARLAPRRASIRLLDYGGGRGTFAARMRELGFDTASYDPFFKSEFEPSLGEKFELIHCREVIEHSPDPRSFALDLVRFLRDDGVVYLSTVLQPPDILELGLRWWYAAQRNGHISLFSRESLGVLWHELGLQFGCFDDVHHIAWRGSPACLSCFTSPP